MRELESLFIFPKKLDEFGISYMITGSIAGIIYSEPRVTHDIDMVIHLSIDEIAKLQKAFGEDEFYCPPEEVLRLEILREIHGHFNVIHHESGYKADFYPLSKDGIHQWAFPLRRQAEYEGNLFWVAPVEYVILRKLQYYREGGSDKHQRDVVKILATSGGDIDMEVLNEKVKQLQLESIWEQWQKDE